MKPVYFNPIVLVGLMAARRSAFRAKDPKIEGYVEIQIRRVHQLHSQMGKAKAYLNLSKLYEHHGDNPSAFYFYKEYLSCLAKSGRTETITSAVLKKGSDLAEKAGNVSSAESVDIIIGILLKRLEVTLTQVRAYIEKGRNGTRPSQDLLMAVHIVELAERLNAPQQAVEEIPSA